MAGPSDELPIPQRLQAIIAQWDQLRAGFDDATLAARVAELEEAMGAPGFWDDQQRPRRSARARAPTRRLERCAGWRSDIEDLEGAGRAGRGGRLGRRRARRADRRRRAAPGELEQERLFSGPLRRAATRWSRSTPAPAAPTPRTGPRWCCAWRCAGPSGAASRSSCWRPRRGRRPASSRRPSASTGENAYGLYSAEKGVHRLVRLSPVRLRPPPPDELRGRRGRAGRRGRRRDRDRGRRPADRHLPRVGRGRPARQQDRLGGADHPPAERDRRAVPERALAVGQQGRRR